ncbi:MAG: restriction endonuclease subunit S, partial [Planktothrix agardhii KL2]|nr:restriction endonuclease subunit S [Planktothrix agardhii KL2]
MSEWKEIFLEDIADEITVGFVGSMTTEYTESGVPFLRSKNVEPYRINWNDIRYISQNFHKKIKKSALTPDDVVIVRTGNPGAASLIPESLTEANCSDLVIVSPGEKLDKRFLVYYLNSIA